MQVNRLSTGLQEELKIASHFNTARSDTLFENAGGNGDGKKTDFGDFDIDKLGITSRQIEDLLDGFSDEVIKVFSSDISPENQQGDVDSSTSSGQEPSPTFSA